MQAALILDPTVEGRIEDDFYETPAWCVEGLLRQTQWHVGGSVVFDPSAGRGAILNAARSLGARVGIGIELDPGRAATAGEAGHFMRCEDALPAIWGDADYGVGNPPFSLALEFAERAAQWSRDYGRPFALLLRLGFMASRGRSAFHRTYPSHLFPLAKRPAFRTDRKGTDKYDVGWFVWMPDGSSSWAPIPHPDDWAGWGREVRT